MGEDPTRFRAEFNGSLRVAARPERLTSEADTFILRVVIERLGITPWLVERIEDADALRDDAALRLAVSSRRGISPLPVDIDWHGHCHARIYHPLVASLGDTGDLLDVRLRKGAAHTAEGALDFILPLLDCVEDKLCQVAATRIDAGFPEEKLLGALEDELDRRADER